LGCLFAAEALPEKDDAFVITENRRIGKQLVSVSVSTILIHIRRNLYRV